MTGNGNIRRNCLLVLCAFVAVVAQAASGIPQSQPSSQTPQGVLQSSSAGDRDRYAADLGEPEESAPGSLDRRAEIPAVQQVSPADAGDQDGLAQTFLDDRLAVWRQRLNLNDWRISIRLTPRADLKPNTLGGIRWDKAKKSAVIWVLDASDYRLAFRDMLDDMEFTLVHELVHLELASLPRSEASRSTEEHAVNRIADALLGLDRKR